MLLQALFPLRQTGFLRLQLGQALLQFGFTVRQGLVSRLLCVLQRGRPQPLRGFQHLGRHAVAQILGVLVQPQPCAEGAEPGVQHRRHGVG